MLGNGLHRAFRHTAELRDSLGKFIGPADGQRCRVIEQQMQRHAPRNIECACFDCRSRSSASARRAFSIWIVVVRESSGRSMRDGNSTFCAVVGM